MGMVVAAIMVVVFGVSMILGCAALGLHFWATQRARGSWAWYGAIATLGALLFAAVGAIVITTVPESYGAPTSEEMNQGLLGLILCAGAPGAGLVLGALAALKRGRRTG